MDHDQHCMTIQTVGMRKCEGMRNSRKAEGVLASASWCTAHAEREIMLVKLQSAVAAVKR